MLVVFMPKTKQALGVLSMAHESFNNEVFSDRSINENYIGRLCGLWNILISKCRWNKDLYYPFFKFGVTLTNFIINWRLIRLEDNGKFY